MIPKIIHQIWEGREDPLSDFYQQLGETWKEHHPDWKYEVWGGDRMENFVKNHYPDFVDIYFNYKYSVHRWDVIRYLILYKIGGMYVDFDYECFESFDRYLTEGKCYFAMEPENHCRAFGKDIYFNNALMATPPEHPFFKAIIEHIQITPIRYTKNKTLDVLSSTGPLMLTNLYEKFENKTDIHLFSAEQVSPWTQNEVRNYKNDTANEEILEKKLEKAIAIHYFWGSW